MRSTLLVSTLLWPGGASPDHSKGSGAKVALTQGAIDYTRDKFLPLLVNYVEHFDLPNPLARGTDYSIEWKVENVLLSDLAVRSKVDVSSPNRLTVDLQITGLQASAGVHAKEKVWPNPHASATVHASTSRSSAVAQVSVLLDETKQIPSLKLTSCKSDINLEIKMSGLGLLNKVADLIVKQFRGDLDNEIGKVICNAVGDGVGKLNGILGSLPYQQDLGSDLQDSIIDFHVTERPVVSGTPPWLVVADGAEFISHNHSHFPLDPPLLPELKSLDIQDHMVTVQVSPWPFNSALWTARQEGLLEYDLRKSDLPDPAAKMLNTGFWGNWLPDLRSKFPEDTDMLLRVNTESAPTATLGADEVRLQGQTLLNFVILAHDAEVPAFTFATPVVLQGLPHLSEDGTRVTGEVSMDDVQVIMQNSSFGKLGPIAMMMVNPSMNLALQHSLVPKANSFLARGYPIPRISTNLANISFRNPKLSAAEGYLLVGADVVLDLLPCLGNCPQELYAGFETNASEVVV